MARLRFYPGLLLRALLCSTLLTVAGCSGCDSDSARHDASPGRPAAAEDGYQKAVSFIDELSTCDVDHRGLLIDLGSEALVGRYGHRLIAPQGIVQTEHDGGTWAQVYDRKLKLSFLLLADGPLFVSLRAIGRDASRVSVSLDGILLGTLKIGRKEIRVASTRTTAAPVDAGQHVLQLRFRGNKSSNAEPFAELDWVRIGIPDELERTYGAPTLKDLLAPAAQLAGVPHRALAMRGPCSVRCSLRVPPHGRLRASVGMRGDGDGTAAIIVHADGEEPEVLERTDVKGGADATWTDLDVSLHRFASRIVTLELAATETTGTGRLLLGDPTLDVPAVPVASTSGARAAVVVILDGVERSDLPPWRNTETPHLPVLNELARNATVFDGHRAPSTLVAAVVASLVSGVSPSTHTLRDRRARLPEVVSTIAGIARDASVPAAMFTGVPTTFEPFGFAFRWDSFTQYPPNGGRLASAPIDDAAKWLCQGSDRPEQGRPRLAVIHARGGHPPWEVTPSDAAKLPPADYTGYLGPRRAAQLLAKVGGRHSRLSEADRERMRALYFTGLSRQDAALGKLIQALQDAGRWDSTLLIVTGDVASARQSLFTDGLDMDETLLELPLYVHFPLGLHARQRLSQPTEVYDLTRTVLSALGLKPPPGMVGRDLASLAAGVDHETHQLRVAFTEDQYSARWGGFALHGRLDQRPKLCQLSVDPTCTYDHSARFPIIAQALFRQLAAAELRRRDVPVHEPVKIDAEMEAMLKVWGAVE